MFSKACEYGLKAVLYIALQSQLGTRAGLKDIALEIDSPEAFTAKILQQLVRSNIINSIKGPNGGFEIDVEKMNTIRLKDVVLAIDGDRLFKGCAMGLKDCSEQRPCPIHSKFVVVRTNLIRILDSTSLEELAEDINTGLSFLKK